MFSWKSPPKPRPHESWSDNEKKTIGWTSYTDGPNHQFIHFNKFNMSGQRELTDSEIKQLSDGERYFQTIEEDGKTIQRITGDLPMEYWDAILKQLQDEYKTYANHKKVQLAASIEETTYNRWSLTETGQKYVRYDKLMSEHGQRARFSHTTALVVPEHVLQRYIPRAALGRSALKHFDRINAVGLAQAEKEKEAEFQKDFGRRPHTPGEHLDSAGKFVQVFNRSGL